MADIFDVLADKTRRDLLTTLLQRRLQSPPNGELSVTELVESLRLSQPTVSKHLQRLREHGLVRVRTDGQHHYYRLDARPMEEVARWVGDFLPERPGSLGDSIGRKLANSTHQARGAVAEASEKVSARLPKIGRRKTMDSE